MAENSPFDLSESVLALNYTAMQSRFHLVKVMAILCSCPARLVYKRDNNSKFLKLSFSDLQIPLPRTYRETHSVRTRGRQRWQLNCIIWRRFWPRHVSTPQIFFTFPCTFKDLGGLGRVIHRRKALPLGFSIGETALGRTELALLLACDHQSLHSTHY